ncbi:uncharacterized protein BO80DRAFT_218362 [Aspergillus ibericus CBS 121593]|uniref:Uncharacterized protein n=1 Tax=Aspergillus ibericus CBS 121593 TaxID=1448316 RepID=A0A395GMJ6_9EURO|nr:hypothetical protein BO80DRAFT_218362 [Aspergillus ibericus CBS 121593]RAK96699.1 hypothetical protein BO80DRAFT_218362 [Aspergillus ibericus CBS 121593]
MTKIRDALWTMTGPASRANSLASSCQTPPIERLARTRSLLDVSSFSCFCALHPSSPPALFRFSRDLPPPPGPPSLGVSTNNDSTSLACSSPPPFFLRCGGPLVVGACHRGPWSSNPLSRSNSIVQAIENEAGRLVIRRCTDSAYGVDIVRPSDPTRVPPPPPGAQQGPDSSSRFLQDPS